MKSQGQLELQVPRCPAYPLVEMLMNQPNCQKKKASGKESRKSRTWATANLEKQPLRNWKPRKPSTKEQPTYPHLGSPEQQFPEAAGPSYFARLLHSGCCSLRSFISCVWIRPKLQFGAFSPCSQHQGPDSGLVQVLSSVEHNSLTGWGK